VVVMVGPAFDGIIHMRYLMGFGGGVKEKMEELIVWWYWKEKEEG